MTATQTHRRRTATVNLPIVFAEFHAPKIHFTSIPLRVPDRGDLAETVSAIRTRLPSPMQVAYYAGLGVLGVLELVEWPVALAIGVATAIAQHAKSSQQVDVVVPRREESPRPRFVEPERRVGT